MTNEKEMKYLPKVNQISNWWRYVKIKRKFVGKILCRLKCVTRNVSWKYELKNIKGIFCLGVWRHENTRFKKILKSTCNYHRTHLNIFICLLMRLHFFKSIYYQFGPKVLMLQFNNCSVIWLFYSCTLKNSLNHIH